MTVPHAELPINYAVTCQTCAVTIWQGSHLVEDDGLVLLAAYAPVACTRPDCPHQAPAAAG
jgi:hypothetical protein